MVSILALASSWARPARADVHHDLSIHLDLGQQLLSGIDRLRLTPSEGLQELVLSLAGRAQLQAVRLDGRSIPYRFDSAEERLHVAINSDWHGHILEIRYSCKFDDRAPEEPINTDNPGYGVIGTISPRGVFLLAGAHWYPQAVNDRSITLAVEAPRGFLAVTSGDLIEHRDLPGRTLSRWHCDPVIEGMSLTAGPFIHHVRPLNGISVATYFSAALDHLSETYLEAAAGHLQLYQELFGPFAFNQFAVVENFFPTGYGFPGYTLLGGRVLQLPFIPQTSLGHEIAHCWWGNGVLVDPRLGNWAEGLTSYVAEHLFKERLSDGAAQDQRREWLRNYAALVPPDSTMALADFRGRVDPLTKTIGYDKGAMVFHMLRRTVGDTVFWRTLRDLYVQRRFRKTNWADLRAAFEAHSGMALDTFFTQWIARPGAPRLSLEAVETRRTPQGWTVSGRLRQAEPVYALSVPLTLSAGETTVSQTVVLEGRSKDFEFRVEVPPSRLTADPQVDLFRRLAPEELPVTINALRGAGALRLSVAPPAGAPEMAAARILRSAFAAPASEILTTPLDPRMTDRALVQVGLPPGMSVWNAVSPAFSVHRDHFTLLGRTYPRDRYSFFGVFDPNRYPAALFLPAGDPSTVERVAAKVSHYGNYSFLVFDGTRNELKGTWPVPGSPLIVHWPQDPSGKAINPSEDG